MAKMNNKTYRLHIFDKLVTESEFGINCTGVKKSGYSKYLWLEGYKEAIKRLEPSCIIRYGEKMPGEAEKMSVYFENENYKMLKNGRKR